MARNSGGAGAPGTLAGSESAHLVSMLAAATLLHKAARETALWTEALDKLCDAIACVEVFDVARAERNKGVEVLPLIESLACRAALCAKKGEGACARESDEAKRQACAALAEHLALAAASTRLYTDAVLRLPAVEALDDFRQALLICDRDLQLVHANRAATDALARGEWIYLEGRRLRFSPSLDRRLREPLASARSQERVVLELPLAGTLWLRQLPGTASHPPLVLLGLVLSPERRARELPPDQLAGALAPLGLTPRQRDLAARLLAGMSLTRAAADMEISRTTANEHLRALFERSGTRRQTDLVAWLVHRVAG